MVAASRLPVKDMYCSMDVVFARYFGNLVMFVISFRCRGLDSSVHIKKIVLGYLFVELLEFAPGAYFCLLFLF